MTRMVLGRTLQRDLMHALGISEAGVLSVSLTMDSDKVATVNVVRAVSLAESESLANVVARYALVELADKPPQGV